MTSVAVVILNYNGEKLLQQFLPSVIQHSGPAEIYVADNGSTDGSLLVLRKLFPQVQVLELGENRGFCGGYNRALQRVSAEYYMLLNSDIEVTPSWLEPLVAVLEKNPAAAAIQPKILSYRNKKEFEYAGAAGGFLDTLGYPFCRGRIFEHVEQDLGQYDDERPVFWATGACMLIRSAQFHKWGGFDDSFFAHMEEIDLCWKLNRANQKVYYSGKSTVYHLGAGTLGYHHPQKTYLNFRNGLSLIFKHLDGAELLYKLPLRMGLDWLAALIFLARGEGKHFISVLKAHRDFIGQWKQLARKRRSIRGQNPSYPRGHIHPGLIVFDYFLRRRRTFPLQ